MLSTILALALAAPTAAPAENDVLLDSLTSELARSKKGLPGEKDAPLYYLSYRVTDGEAWSSSATFGALEGQAARGGKLTGRVRLLDISARVGSRELDNTHKVRGGFDFDFGGGGRTLPIDDDKNALEVALWKATDDAVRDATMDLLKVRANVAV